MKITKTINFVSYFLYVCNGCTVAQMIENQNIDPPKHRMPQNTKTLDPKMIKLCDCIPPLIQKKIGLLKIIKAFPRKIKLLFTGDMH